MQTEQLDAVFSALADPTRRAMLARLSEQGDLSVSELAQPFAISLPTVSRHLDVLEDAGLIIRHREAQKRRCEFQRQPLMAANEWISRYVAFWEARIDALQHLVEGPREPAKPKEQS